MSRGWKFLLCAIASTIIAIPGCALKRPDAETASAPATEPHPLGPEMAQLEKDLASEAYRSGVLGMRNFNDLNGEILRIDVADNARRFAAANGGAEKLSSPGAPPEPAAAYARRSKIETEFLALIRASYQKLGMEAMYERQLASLFSESEAAARPAAGPAALEIAPILPAPGAENEWPRWRGPSGQGRSSETGLPLRWSASENVAWKAPVPGRGHSSPVIWGERIFLTTAFDNGKRRSLVCLRRADGEPLWTADAPFVEPEGRVIAKNSYASATPATDGERVVAFFGNTGLVAFDFDGDLLWHVPFEPFDAMHGTGASPVLCGGLAILFQEQSDKDSIGIAVDKRSGEKRWQVKLPRALGWSTPQPLRVGGRDELVYGAHRTVLAFDPASGAELWRCDGPTIEVVPTVVYGNGLVYSASGRNGPTLALRPGGSGDVSASHLAWKVTRGAPHVPSPVLSGELLYLVNDRGLLTCLDAETGATVYQKRLEGQFSASPIAADGKIYLTNESGDTFVVRDGRDFEILAVNPLGEGVLASMAVLGGRIYIRGERHLFAIEGGG
jgi:hypothetical protein